MYDHQQTHKDNGQEDQETKTNFEEVELEQKDFYQSIKSFFNDAIRISIYIFAVIPNLERSNPTFETRFLLWGLVAIICVSIKIWLLHKKSEMGDYVNSPSIINWILVCFKYIAIFAVIRFMGILRIYLSSEPTSEEFWILVVILIAGYLETYPEILEKNSRSKRDKK